MKLKVIYRKNLKMSPGKLAAQACHAVLGLQSAVKKHSAVVVLEASDKKFFEKIEEFKRNGIRHHVVTDAGLTEVEPGTNTCLAYIEEN